MMRRSEIINWLNSLEGEDPLVGIDDGGLALSTEDEQNWCGIGGLPLPADEPERAGYTGCPCCD